MKTYKVREIWVIKGWTRVEASSKKEALAKLEAGEGVFKMVEDEKGEYPIDTDWDSLKEDKDEK